jgi:hypothetical protein
MTPLPLLRPEHNENCRAVLPQSFRPQSRTKKNFKLYILNSALIDGNTAVNQCRTQNVNVQLIQNAERKM